ncbi:MAG: cytochrome P450 [Actinomycetota bacterium]|nr:cytochrome P450 [Actinomycetota bacterium]
MRKLEPERPPSFWRVASELRAELRDRPQLPPGDLRFSLARTHRLQRDTLRMMLEHYERYGPVFTVRALHRPLVVLIGPEANHFVTVSGADNFSWRKGMFGEYLAPLIGDGLITTDGEYHDRARLIMMPAFHRRRLDAAVAVMLDEAGRALADWRPGQAVDLYQWVRDLAMTIAMRAVVGLDPGEAGVGREAAALFERVLAFTNAEVWATLLRGPGTPWARMQSARRDLDEIIYAEIGRRRQSGASGEDILSMLIEAREEPDRAGRSGADGAGRTAFSDTELRDQLLHMLFGGHDTSSSTLAFLLYELTRHPAVVARVVAEQDAVLGGHAPTAEQLMNGLPELRMAVEETLRLYPPVWMGPRLAVKSFEFGGHHVPAGTHVMHSSWVTHHLPEVFPDPEAFVPERFTPEARRAIPRGGYLPFGGGQRICIGKRFGQLMVEAIATAMLQRFRLELQAGYELRLEKLPTLSPGNGMPMVVRERRSVAPGLETTSRTTAPTVA